MACFALVAATVECQGLQGQQNADAVGRRQIVMAFCKQLL